MIYCLFFRQLFVCFHFVRRGSGNSGPLCYLYPMKECQAEECFCTEYNRKFCKDYREPKVVKKSGFKRKPTGELALFQKLWDSRVHVCRSCGKGLREFNVSFFSHIIPKGKRKDLRLDPDNIILECIDCHGVWEHGRVKEKYVQHSFKEKLRYISLHDKELYAKWVFLLEQHNLPI